MAASHRSGPGTVRGRASPEEVFSFRALWEAASRAARGKRRRAGMARFRLTLEDELLRLRAQLLDGTWQPGRGETIAIRDPKPRTITVPTVHDRVVHHAMMEVLGPRIERRLIHDTYACRVGRGTHAAHARARAWARTYRYYIHLDVEQFFPTIDHTVVRAHLAQDVPEPWLRHLCERILDAGGGPSRPAWFPGDDLLAPLARRTGLPLGSLTSQWWANRYLDPVDHLVKDRRRHRPYLRYMDDLLLFGDDRADLKAIGRLIEEAMWGLRLRLHRWEVMPCADGLGFVGYRTLPDRVRVKRSTVARAERRLRLRLQEMHSGQLSPAAFRDGLRSTFAHWDFADSFRLKGRLLRRLGLLSHPGAPPEAGLSVV